MRNSDVTFGEYVKQVYPEIYETYTEEQKMQMEKVKMNEIKGNGQIEVSVGVGYEKDSCFVSNLIKVSVMKVAYFINRFFDFLNVERAIGITIAFG